MSLKVTDSGPPIVQPSTCFKNLLLNLKVNSEARFINSSENQFRANWCQLFMNINLFSDIVDCILYWNICK